jgi:hypothetical protein
MQKHIKEVRYMDTADSSENVAQIYRTARRHIQQANSLQTLA